MTKERVALRVSDEPSLAEQATLVERFRSGDRAAITALVRMWEQRLLTIAYRVVSNLPDAEEVRQTVLVRLAQSPQKLPDASRFAGWLRRCVINEAISWLRRRDAETKRQEPFDDALPSRVLSPTDQAIAAERSRRLRRALRQLDPDLRHCSRCGLMKA